MAVCVNVLSEEEEILIGNIKTESLRAPVLFLGFVITDRH